MLLVIVLLDLGSIFNWNVKQLFLYLTAEYETDNNASFQVSIMLAWIRFD